MKKAPLLFLLFVLISFLLNAQTDNDNITDSQGRKQGYWKKFQDKTLLYEGEFKNDVPTGTFKYYYPNGKLKSISNFINGVHRVETTMYDENEKMASKGVFIDQQKDGLWLYYNTTNNLRDLRTDEGIILKKETYKKGVKDGLFQIFSAETAILLDEQHYKEGKLHGTSINYYVSGDTNTIYNYIDGKLNGRYISYYPNKKIYERGIYHLDQKIGDWNYFDFSGKLRKTVRHNELNGEETVLYFYQGSEPQPIKQNLIAYIKKIDDASFLVTLTNNKSFVFKDSYTTILDWLDFINFTPINKTHIAATGSIKSFSDKGKGSISVKIFPDLELLTDGDYAQNIMSLFNRETLKEE